MSLLETDEAITETFLRTMKGAEFFWYSSEFETKV